MRYFYYNPTFYNMATIFKLFKTLLFLKTGWAVGSRLIMKRV